MTDNETFDGTLHSGLPGPCAVGQRSSAGLLPGTPGAQEGGPQTALARLTATGLASSLTGWP